MYTKICPYHSCVDDDYQGLHVVTSEYWDVIEEKIEECRKKASPELRGELQALKDIPTIVRPINVEL